MKLRQHVVSALAASLSLWASVVGVGGSAGASGLVSASGAKVMGRPGGRRG